jgi:hypothetical protein
MCTKQNCRYVSAPTSCDPLADRWRVANHPPFSREGNACFRCQMGFPLHRSACSEMVEPIPLRGDSSLASLDFQLCRNSTGLERDRGTKKRSVYFHLRLCHWIQRRCALHSHRVPERTKSIRNAWRGRPRGAVRWMDSALWSLVPLVFVGDGYKAHRSPRERIAGGAASLAIGRELIYPPRVLRLIVRNADFLTARLRRSAQDDDDGSRFAPTRWLNAPHPTLCVGWAPGIHLISRGLHTRISPIRF